MEKLHFLCSVYCHQVLWQVVIISIQQENGDFFSIANYLMMERRQIKKTQHCKANDTPFYSNCVKFLFVCISVKSLAMLLRLLKMFRYSHLKETGQVVSKDLVSQRISEEIFSQK